MVIVKGFAMLKTMQKHGVTLAIFAAVLTGLTALVNALTKTTIDEQAAKQQKALFDQVIPSDVYDNDLQKSCFVVQAPQLGKGTHRVFIARKGDKAVGAGHGSDGPRRVFRCHSTARWQRFFRYRAGYPRDGTS
jgi:electron transport complex protein RnfG